MSFGESYTNNETTGVDSPEGTRGIFMDDGMDPIAHPATLTADNLKEIFGQAFPEGLDPEIFDNGGSLSLAE